MSSDSLGRFWRTIVETMTDGVLVVDPTSRIVAANRALAEMMGYEAAELLGSHCSVLGCDSCIVRDGQKKDRAVCDLFAMGKVVRRRCRLRRKDGTILPALKNAAVLCDEDGTLVGGVETITDLTDILEKEEVIRELRHLLLPEEGFAGIIGQSRKMREAFELIRNAALSDAPIVIYGESGTGKELAASAVHSLGPRSGMAMIKVSCAALSETLLESELFGHVKGAFTGAVRNRIGRFEAASGGDLFLDEIGDIPLAMQVKLLRVLQEKEIERVGSQKPIPVNVRIIAATNRDLKALCSQGRFREDLFYRLNVIPIHLPPLRERRDDIPLLVDHFVRAIRLRTGKAIHGVSGEAMEMLIGHAWPGNVRELINVLEYAFVVCRGEIIMPRHLPSLAGGPVMGHVLGHPGEGGGGRERQAILAALRESGGRRDQAARLLGISRVTLWKRLKREGIRVNGRVIATDGDL